MSIDRSSSTSSQAESVSVSGLTTPQLNSGEVTGNGRADTTITSSQIPFSKESSSESNDESNMFDITLEIEDKLKVILDSVDKNDSEINDRIDKLTKKIEQIEASIQN